MQSKSPRLLPSLRAAIRLRHFSPRTEEAYVGWVVRFVRYHGLTPPSDLTERDVLAFLTHLAVERRMAPSTLAQALAAISFLYREILRTPLTGLGQIPQIKGPERLPVVLTPSEVQRVLGQLQDRMWLIGMLLHGVACGSSNA
jgi:site-specific recombinase XerD